MSIPVELAKIQTGDTDRLRVTEPFLSLCAAIILECGIGLIEETFVLQSMRTSVGQTIVPY